MRYDQYDEVTSAPDDAQILLNRPSMTSAAYPNGTPATISPANLTTGTDAVLSVNGVDPDGDGNVLLAAADVGALAPDGDGSGLTGVSAAVGDLIGSASPDFARVFVAGHSYASGYLSTEGGERWPARLAASLGAEEVTYAVTSAVLALDSSGSNGGGYANVLNALTPRVSSGVSYAPRTTAPYLPLSPVSVFNYGFNDLGYLTATTSVNVAWFKMAQRACCCVARAGGYFPDMDASVAYGGSGGSHWTGNTDVEVYGSPTNHSTTTLADTVTITVPADFPGGEVDLLTLAFAGGAKWSTVVDGGSAQVLDGTGSAFGANSGTANLVVQRLTGLAAGTHAIVMTLTALDGGAQAFFDSWLIAAPQVPLTVLCTQPTAPALPYTPGGSPAHTPVTSSDVTALNTAVTALAAEFTDGLTAVADVGAYFADAAGNVASTSPGSLYVSDGLHPNAAGHGVIARCVRDAIRSAPSPGAARTAPMSVLMRQIGGPLEPGFNTDWSATTAGGAGFAWFGKDQAGNTLVQLKISKSSAGMVNEVIALVPPGYQPAAQALLPGVAWASGYGSLDAAFLAIETDGTIRWFSGDPTTEIDVTFSWPANGLGS